MSICRQLKKGLRAKEPSKPNFTPQQLVIDSAYSMVRLQILGRAKAHTSLCDEHLTY